MKSRQKMVASVAVLAVAACGLCCVGTAEAAERLVTSKVPSSRQRPIGACDHSPFDALLRKHVTNDGRVNYDAWSNSAADRSKLKDYLQAAAYVDPSRPASTEETLAFYINLYNALTIHGILEEYPTASIRKHQSVLPGGYKIWDDLKVAVGGSYVSLNDIEHRTLRPIGDPRIHFAIVCASIGCPKLRNEAYLPEAVDLQLTDNARDFFRQDRNFVLDLSAGKVKLSSILKWFADDFGASGSAVLERIAPWLPEADGAFVRSNASRLRVGYLNYDWSINKT